MYLALLNLISISIVYRLCVGYLFSHFLILLLAAGARRTRRVIASVLARLLRGWIHEVLGVKKQREAGVHFDFFPFRQKRPKMVLWTVQVALRLLRTMSWS